MGLHGLSMIALLIIFLIAVLLFGTQYLRLLVEDLGIAVKNCTKALRNQVVILLMKKLKSEKLDGDSG